jgi:hypothetical protein
VLRPGDDALNESHSIFHFPFSIYHVRSMIAALTGKLRHVEENRVHLESGPILYELLVPAADLTELQVNLGKRSRFIRFFIWAVIPRAGGWSRR